MERKEQKVQEQEAVAIRRSTEQTTRESTREERRCKMLELCLQRDQFAYEQKKAAIKRAVQLVASNQAPIVIPCGSAAAKAAAYPEASKSVAEPPAVAALRNNKRQRVGDNLYNAKPAAIPPSIALHQK
jgi:hypothetical protein